MGFEIGQAGSQAKFRQGKQGQGEGGSPSGGRTPRGAASQPSSAPPPPPLARRFRPLAAATAAAPAPVPVSVCWAGRQGHVVLGCKTGTPGQGQERSHHAQLHASSHIQSASPEWQHACMRPRGGATHPPTQPTTHLLLHGRIPLLPCHLLQALLSRRIADDGLQVSQLQHTYRRVRQRARISAHMRGPCT